MQKKHLSIKKIRKKILQNKGDNLNINLPKSEVWFWQLYEKNKLNSKYDKKNTAFKYYIPDVLNKKEKYVIEIDGSVHINLKQKTKDIKKDYFYYKKGFMVFRITAFSLKSFYENMKKLKQYREKQSIKKLKKQLHITPKL